MAYDESGMANRSLQGKSDRRRAQDAAEAHNVPGSVISCKLVSKERRPENRLSRTRIGYNPMLIFLAAMSRIDAGTGPASWKVAIAGGSKRGKKP